MILSKNSSLYLVVLLFLLASCASSKQTVYLQKPTNDSTELSHVIDKHMPTIQANDLLTIVVSASDMKASMPFNQQNPFQMNAVASPDLAFRPVYIVDENGEITFPILGKIKLKGLNRTQAIELLTDRLKHYIENPGVNLSYSNFRITVLGEVAKPGNFTLPQERVSVLEALGLAGDMTIKGVRDNVLLIREKDGIRTTHRLNLTSEDLLSSPYFYLMQNDVLYVQPNSAQVRDSSFGQNTNVLISVSSLVITILTLVFTLNRK